MGAKLQQRGPGRHIQRRLEACAPIAPKSGLRGAPGCGNLNQLLKPAVETVPGSAMSGLTKCFLAIGVLGVGLGLYVSYTSAPLNPIWTLAFPLGVISLGLAFIFHVLREPTAQFNAEQQAQLRLENPEEDAESHPHSEIATRHAH